MSVRAPIDSPLPYVERLATRDTADVDLLVVHCTELPDLAIALVETGEFAAAESLLEETMREAKRLDHAGVQAHAMLAGLLLQL